MIEVTYLPHKPDDKKAFKMKHSDFKRPKYKEDGYWWDVEKTRCNPGCLALAQILFITFFTAELVAVPGRGMGGYAKIAARAKS